MLHKRVRLTEYDQLKTKFCCAATAQVQTKLLNYICLLVLCSARVQILCG